MQLKEVIERIDKSDSNKDEVDIANLAYNEFDLNINGWVEQEQLLSYWITLDAENWVGKRLYFFDGKAVAYSDQKGRKNDEEFKWLSKEAYLTVRDYLVGFLFINDDEPDIISDSEDIGDHYNLFICNQIGDGYKAKVDGRYIEIQDRVKHQLVICPTGKGYNRYDDDQVSVKFFDTGEEKIVNVEEIDFMFRFKD
jgi:hypothetical protein